MRLLYLFAAVASTVEAADAPTALAILEKNCAGCHGAAAMSGLDLRTRESLLKGGTRGAAVLPGRKAESAIYRAVQGIGDLKMPPGKPGITAAILERQAQSMSDTEAAQRMQKAKTSLLTESRGRR